MSVSAWLDVRIYSKRQAPMPFDDILHALADGGWHMVYQGCIHYLPIGDKDDFAWQCDPITEETAHTLFRQKKAAGELIGVELYWQDTDVGVSLLRFKADVLSFGCSISRKVLVGNITDVSWYLERILPALNTKTTQVESFDFRQD